MASEYKVIVKQGQQGAPGVGMPAGGTTGQHLAKASNADFDIEWSSEAVIVADINDITNVTITGAATDEVLTWDGAKWVNSAIPGHAWGTITGTLSAQTDLQSALDGKSDTGHAHVKADITDFNEDDYATGAEGDLATSALQNGDNVSELVNDAGYITGISGGALNDLSDVNDPTPVDGQFLYWNQGAGEYRTKPLEESDVSSFQYTNNQIDTFLLAKADDADLTSHTGNTSNPHSVTKTQVGLPNVDNTSDADKPVSTATQTALDLKADDADLTSHTGSTSNPHSVTATQVGLGNCDNTSDADKPVSTATQTALDGKSDVPTTGTVQTTDATATVLMTVAVPTDEEKMYDIKVHGHEDATDDHLWKRVTCTVKNISGTASLVGGVDAATGYDAGASAWTIVTSVSSGNVIVTVTGEAAHTIDWRFTVIED